MKITIHYSTKTGTVKQAFNKIFPYLKIEFVKGRIPPEYELQQSNLILHNRFLGEINGDLRNGFILIKNDDKPSWLEQSFHKQFGLPIQVFRKQKKKWILATTTEDLTLHQQNEIARESCTLCFTENLPEAS